MSRLCAPFLLLAWLAAGAAAAHDFWIEPSAWQPNTRERIAVNLCLGERFVGRPTVRNAARIEEFFLSGGGAPQPVIGLDGSDPAGSVRVASPAGHVLGYRSNRAYVEMPGSKFEDYLREKGLDAVLALKPGQRSGGRPVREAYSRYAKSLIGPGGPAAIDRALGFPFELVALPPDRAAAADGAQAFGLLFDGKPLAGALVVATRRPAAQVLIEARTDARGRVALPLAGRGSWLVTAVHMVPALRALDAEWESFWASLTFGSAPADTGTPRCDERPALLVMQR